MYTYKAIVSYVYDGDSITLDIDLGFGVWLKNQKTRLYAVDTPELRGDEREEGLRVRDIVRGWLPIGSEVAIKTHKDRKGKFGRWLVEVFPEGWEKSVNDTLLEQGLAVSYG